MTFWIAMLILALGAYPLGRLLRKRNSDEPYAEWFAVAVDRFGFTILESFPVTKEEAERIPKRDAEDLEDELAGYAFYTLLHALEEGVNMEDVLHVSLYFNDETDPRARFAPDVEDDKLMGVKPYTSGVGAAKVVR